MIQRYLPAFLVSLILSASLLFGQAYDQGAGSSPNFFGGGGDPASNQNNMNIGAGGGLFESQTSENMADRVFNVDSDSVDLEDGTFNWKGRTFNLGNNRVARARFERYLASPDLSDSDEIYLGILKRIEELLSLVGEDNIKDAETLTDEIFQAWQMLFKAARYEMDQGISIVVANQVYNIWRIRDENHNLTRARGILAEEKEDQQDLLASNSWISEREFEERQRLKAQGRHTGAEFEGVTQATFQAQRVAELQSKITAMDTQGIANGIQAKLQFQSQILNLLLSRRFEHCIIASNFYRFAFKGSHQTITVGSEQLEEFMPISDFTPTVETVELLAREAETDVKTGMRTVESLYASNELYGALERLQETFYLGEYTPEVLQFPAEKKRPLLDLYRKTRELQTLIDLKDYEGIENLIAEVKEMAYDFPASQVLSGVRSAQRMSNLALMSAQQAVATGDFAKAESNLEKATQIWPLNPAIKSFTTNMANRADIGTQATLMFDELITREDYRAIYDKSAEFTAALIQDLERSKLLKEAATSVGRVDFIIAGARELDNQGNSYAAWEALVGAEEILPDDPELARVKAKMAPRVADFVGSLDMAEQAEDKEQYAISLSRLLEAQDIYPTSKICHHGIERVSKKLMAELPRQTAVPVGG
ncbi:MAG: hypothetical protein AAFX93_08010 [Verrucomicrobiota bacterium]